jgi:hypothetical protein
MTDYTNHIRKAATWIDRHPHLPAPRIHAGDMRVALGWHVQDQPVKEQCDVLDAVRDAVGDVPWDVKRSGPAMWVVTELDGLTFNVFVSPASLEGFTELDLTTRMTR